MSDRLAVFDHGRIEQVGTPSDVYEHPASAFVAGFVGTSNILSGAVARNIVGSDEAFTIRPEKIRLLEVGDAPAAGEATVTGHVRDVAYVGAFTRFAVSLDGGGELVVMQQNREASSTEALGVLGRAVRLAWDRRNDRAVGTAGTSELIGSQEGER